MQHLDDRGRPGLLRTTLEAQETRGLCRSDDISRLLPSESAMLARGRTVRASKLLFYAKLAEKALQTYERDGWGEFDTRIPDPDRREVRPTADRGPILLCVDTSGSMRGPREVVAKALALECMRAAKVQERGCFVFAFAGPAEVAELELGMVGILFVCSFFHFFHFEFFEVERNSRERNSRENKITRSFPLFFFSSSLFKKNTSPIENIRTPRALTASWASLKRSSTAAPTSTRRSRGASTGSPTARGPTRTS